MPTGNPMIDAALNAGNYSLALKLIDKKIQQQPTSHNLASKCYIFSNAAINPECKNTTEEALKLCLDLASKTISDTNALKLLESAFQLLDYQPEFDLYEAAVRKYSTPALVYEWFKKTIDQNDIVGMQKATMALSKSFKTNTENGRMIKLWAAASMNIAIDCCQDGDRLTGGKTKLLAMLGLKIIETVETESKIPLNAQDMYVKCQLLLKKGDIDDCLKELKMFLSKESDLELLLIYFEQLKLNECWNELYEACVNYLVNIGVDDWNTWKLAILSARKIEKIIELNEIISNYKVGRNSQLAKIKIVDDLEIDDKKKAMENYFKLYMHKLCFYLDLQPFLTDEFLSKSIILEIIEDQFKERNVESIISGEKKATENDLNVLVNYVKLKAYICPELFENEEFFSRCCQFYNCTKFLENKLVEFDYFSGFEFLILAIQSYLTINKSLDKTQTAYNLIVLLENAVDKNKHEFHLLLWLAHCYEKTNLSSCINKIFNSLKIKNIQIDTLGPHFMNRLSSKTRNSELIYDSLRFYSHNVAMELPQMVMLCFENGTFSKLKGFIEFKLRTENSISHYNLVLQNIQNIRTNKEKAGMEDIIMDYIPLLKDAYRVMKLNGNDVDMKLHDNIDRKIIWKCGDHTVHEMPQRFIESEFSGIIDVKETEIMILLQLIIYDQCSRVWDEYKSKFLNIVATKKNLNKFSEIEKYILQLFIWLLDNKNSSEIPPIPEAPKDILSAEFNNYYYSLLDIEKILFTINHQSNSSTFFGEKKKRSQITKATTHFRTLCNKIPRDDILILTKTSIKKAKGESIEWFKNDKFGKQFEIDEVTVNKYYKSLEVEAIKSAKEI